jgi:hypothetical protein
VAALAPDVIVATGGATLGFLLESTRSVPIVFTLVPDDADRRKHWAGVFANKAFVEGFASKFRPLVMTQEVKLLTAAPWGPHP